MMARNPSLKAICRTEGLEDFRMLLKDISEPVLHERRSDARIPQSLILSVQPLNNDLDPVGEPFKAMSRDVTENGIGFLYDSPFPTKYVRIGATEQSLSKVNARVCYNKAYYSDKVVFLVGVEFLTDDKTS